MIRPRICGFGVLLAGLMVAACGGPATVPELEQARAAVQAARNNPDVIAHAATRLGEAQATLQRAEAAGDRAEVGHLAYLAAQEAAVANELAAERVAQQRFEELAEERQDAELDMRTREAEVARERALTAEQRAEQLEQRLAELQARQTERGMVMTLGGDILFEVDQAELTPGGAQRVARLAEFLRDFPERNVLIEGHTDSTGSANYNLDLSLRRANAVQDFLISHGIEPSRIAARGYGQDVPLAPNDTAAGRQQNRRVEIVILEEGQTVPPPGSATPA